jgi:hypothetical protein
MGPSILLELERAELIARERRLTAEAEAEGLVAAARARSAEIGSGADRAIAETIGRRTKILRATASREERRIEREIAALDREPTGGGDDASFREAVALVVAMVLGEPVEREA